MLFLSHCWQRSAAQVRGLTALAAVLSEMKSEIISEAVVLVKGLAKKVISLS